MQKLVFENIVVFESILQILEILGIVWMINFIVCFTKCHLALDDKKTNNHTRTRIENENNVSQIFNHIQ